ncbi:MAG: Holliday junction resolvase RuvX [Acidobacteria bacterium]|nr:Holliday junction resolvase RuvX [Acidobacteriota bacterium]
MSVVRVLGIDVGARRVGLALSDVSATLARPWRVLTRAGPRAGLVRELSRIIDALSRDEDGLQRIVVGLPLRLDGSPNEQTANVLAFVEQLRTATAVPIAMEDERLTSREAESRLAVLERDWRKRKKMLDAAAAAVMLQDYLDAHRSFLSRHPEDDGRTS